jgi:hypothetical protein
MSEDCQRELNDEDDCVVIRDPVKLTAYDRSRENLRSLETKRDALAALALPTPEDQKRLATIERQVENARKRFAEEAKRGLDDVWRKRRGIDEWRKTEEGKTQRNESRRRVRSKPNEDLSGMTPEQRKQHENDLDADNKWMKRQRKKSVPEAEILAALAERVEKRNSKRAAMNQAAGERTEMEQNEHYGKF